MTAPPDGNAIRPFSLRLGPKRALGVLLLAFFLLPTLVWGESTLRILLLNSYHHGYPGSDEIVAGFREVIREKVPGAELTIEYLDSKNNRGEGYDRLLREMLALKYRGKRFDLLVSSDDYAFNLLERHRDEIFGALPVVFCGTNNFDFARIRGKSDFIGFDERPSFGETIGLILSLHPGTTAIHAIHDDTITGKLNAALFREAAGRFPAVPFVFHEGELLEDLVEAAGNAPDGTVMVYFTSVMQDRSGRILSSSDGLEIISRSARVPVYGGWSFNLGHGIVGGMLVNLREHGRAAARAAARMLTGAGVAGEKRENPSPNVPMFDYLQLKRFGIDESRLPPGSVVVNRPPGFFSRYGVVILSSALSLLFFLLIAALVMLERRRNEALRSMERFRAVLVSSPLPQALNDDSGAITFLNPAFTRTFGYTLDDIPTLERWWSAAYPDPAYRNEVISTWGERLREAREGGAPFRPVTVDIRCRDGSTRRAIVDATPLEGGSYREHLVILIDITDREAMLERIRESEQLLRSYIESSPLGVFVVDPSGIVQEVNPAGERMLGHEPGGLRGVPLETLLEGGGDAALRSLVDSGDGQGGEGEFLFRKRGGETIWVSVSAVRLPSGMILSFMQDVTERRAHQERLARAMEAAEAANRAKSQFLANMSHEIRTPMNGIVGMGQLLRLTPLTAEQQQYLDAIESSSENLLSLINDILDLSRIEAGMLQLETIDFDFRKSLDEALSPLQGVARQKGLELTVSVSPDVPRHLTGDPLRLKQVILNLVGNALKFTLHGSVSLTAETVSRTGDQLRLRIAVRDTGIGIAPHHLGVIFEPFRQVDSSTTRRFGGTGLGLSICSRLIQLMGGSIGVESQEGVGSTFTVDIPFGIPPQEDHPLRTAPPAPELRWDGPPLRVLVVDDQEINRMVLLGMLKVIGLGAEIAENGKEALERLESGGIDLVLMDIQMPVMDGITALCRIREREREQGGHLPVLAITARALREEQQRIMAEGFDGYVSKPLDLNELIEKMRGVVPASSR